MEKNKEEIMATQTAQYDHIGSKYDEYARTATLKRAERYTFFRMVGARGGQRRRGVGCGVGVYKPRVNKPRAAPGVGVGI